MSSASFFDLPVDELVKFLASLNPNINWIELIERAERREDKAIELFRSALWIDSSISTNFVTPFRDVNNIISSIYTELIKRGYLPIRFNYSGVNTIVYLLGKPMVGKENDLSKRLPTSVELELFKSLDDTRFYLQCWHIPFEVVDDVEKLNLEDDNSIVVAIYWQLYNESEIKKLKASNHLLLSFTEPNISDQHAFEKTRVYWSVLIANELRVE